MSKTASSKSTISSDKKKKDKSISSKQENKNGRENC